jgi:hypothetical protein
VPTGKHIRKPDDEICDHARPVGIWKAGTNANPGAEPTAGAGPVNGNAETWGVLTRLGRSVLASGGTGTAEPQHREEHRQANWLRDVILGGQDGLVNILGIVLGVIAGGGSRAILLAAGFAAAITESISMGAVGLGVNWIDTAAAYRFGRSEQVVGRVCGFRLTPRSVSGDPHGHRHPVRLQQGLRHFEERRVVINYHCTAAAPSQFASVPPPPHCS